jgi:hypothetical protein
MLEIIYWPHCLLCGDKMNIRRINLFGGPCVSKSTLAAGIFFELKKSGVNIEYVQEFCKEYAYEGKKIKPYDQLTIFAEQVSREYRVLNSSDNIIIVTDCPIFMSLPYAIRYNFVSWRSLLNVGRDFENEYPAINFFIQRGDCPYNQEGRFENLSEAITMDICIEQFLKENQISYIPMMFNDLDLILEKINLFLK